MLKVRTRRLVANRPQAPPLASPQAHPLPTDIEINRIHAFKSDIIKLRLDLLEKICSNAGSIKQQLPVISNFNEMTRYALNASASSVFLIDFKKKELDKFTDGPLGKELVQIPVSARMDIARWILQTTRPLFIDLNKEESGNLFRDEVNGLVTRNIVCAPLIIGGKVKGMIKALNKLDGNDFNERDLKTLAGLAANVALTIENILLNEGLLGSCKDTVKKMVSLLDPRETASSRHAMSVAEYALVGASELSLSDDVKHNIAYAGILHDIGMLSIPQSIINKSSALTREELNTIRKHPVIGYNLLRGIPPLNEVSRLILYHHERYDGRGYPCGLKGDIVPIGARLLSVADAFASMTEKHLYRAAIFARDALEELNKFVGTQFCPVAARAFIVGYAKSRSLGKVVVKKIDPN
jgi:HD-GYP domain-containing protein (c-di-GMP phosphodiesterase class II)